ncbi:MAG: hypothetical protein SFV19_15880 [Rhodospirillaceae bacterium]|nr:hypothetical protein [Rhodospirillaceae bacterium]
MALPDYLQRDHKIIRGRVAYTSNKPDRLGQERGREVFAVTVHNDGRRSLIAHAEIDDRPSVLRFEQLNLDAQWRPTDAFIRITVGDAFRGSGWFRFTATEAECETLTATEGRVSQRWPLSGPTPMFGGHAITNDGWVTKLFDLKGPQTQTLPRFVVSSTDHRGATGPTISMVSAAVSLMGRPTITVKAGTFDALHFRFGEVHGLPVEHPIYEVWVTADGNYTFLKGTVGGYMMTQYELVELSDKL